MKIRKAAENDLNRIMDIYRFARDFMAKTGNPNQWGPNNWPPIDLIKSDIKEGNSYVCLNDNNEVIGTFYYIYGKDVEPTYREIDNGSWLNDEPYGVVHRIAGDGSEKGIGAFCINWAYEKCRHLRIDTHEDNKVMQNLLRKLGFEYRGIIYVREDKDPRLAYEKSMKKKILFICHGNICRSPMAEFVMKSKTGDHYIESAATSLDEIGNGEYPQAREQLIKHGIGGFKDKKARQVRKTDYDDFDYLIIMDEENRHGLERIVGKDVDNKIFKLLDFVDDENLKGRDIDDPWYTREFDLCFDEIDKGCEGLKNFLKYKN